MGRFIRTSFFLIFICGAFLYAGELIRSADPGLEYFQSDRAIFASWLAVMATILLHMPWRELRAPRHMHIDPQATVAFRYAYFERIGEVHTGVVTLALALLMELNVDETNNYSSAVTLFIWGAFWLVRGIWHFRTRPSVALELTPVGLSFTEFTIGLIPWGEIKGVTLKDRLTAKITISLRDQYAHKEQPDWEHRGLIIRCGRLDGKPEEIMDEIQARLRAFGDPARSSHDYSTMEPSLRTTS